MQGVQTFLRSPKLKTLLAASLQRHAHVLEHAQVRKNRGYLKRANDASPGHLRGLIRGDVLTVEDNRSSTWGEKLGEEVEKGGFARTIGPNDGVDVTALDL